MKKNLKLGESYSCKSYKIQNYRNFINLFTIGSYLNIYSDYIIICETHMSKQVNNRTTDIYSHLIWTRMSVLLA